MRLKDLCDIRVVAHGVWPHRQLLIHWTRRLLAQHYAGSLLGPLWTLVTPLFMLAIYTFVFGIVFQARWQALGADLQNTGGYALILFCAMAVFQLFAETVNGSTRVIIDNANLVKKVIFPLQILPVAQMLSATVNSAVWFGLTLAGAFIAEGALKATIWLFPLVLVPLMSLSLGVGWFVAGVTVYLRDAHHVIGLLLQALFFMTPIFYPEQLVPPALQFVITINPLAHLCRQGRELLLFGQIPTLPELLGTWLFCLLLCQLGYIWFTRVQRGFADVL